MVDINSNWGWYNYYTYIKLKPEAKIADVDNKIRATFKKNRPESKNEFYSQAVTDIHLTSNLKWELRPNSDQKYIYIFGTVALFILLIACINYINLTTARSSLRAREIGIRKVSGAIRDALIRQFLTESVLISLLAAIVALIMAQLLLPAINTITGKSLSTGSPGKLFYTPPDILFCNSTRIDRRFLSRLISFFIRTCESLEGRKIIQSSPV